jgi:hypothetical protein
VEKLHEISASCELGIQIRMHDDEVHTKKGNEVIFHSMDIAVRFPNNGEMARFKQPNK